MSTTCTGTFICGCVVAKVSHGLCACRYSCSLSVALPSGMSSCHFPRTHALAPSEVRPRIRPASCPVSLYASLHIVDIAILATRGPYLGGQRLTPDHVVGHDTPTLASYSIRSIPFSPTPLTSPLLPPCRTRRFILLTQSRDNSKGTPP